MDVKTLREALAVSPDNAPLLLLFGNVLLVDHAYDEARDVFDRILKLEPQNDEAWIGRCRAAFLSGKLSESEVRLQALLDRKPDHPGGWILMAKVLNAQGDQARAQHAYTKARTLPGFVADAELEKTLSVPPASKPIPAARTSGSGPASGLAVAGNPDSTQEKDPLADIERPSIRFSDIGGMEAVKEEIRMKILYPLQNQELFKAYGKKIGGGVLLYGPPGCGKTLLSRATAGEIKASFIAIGLHDVLDMWVGNSEKNLHQLFETARQNAPCVMFFDEVDALASDRRDLRQSSTRALINQLLAEMDGNIATNEGVLILAATNAPWHLDPAFLRPGRFDRILFVPPPDETARTAIIEIMAREKPTHKFDAGLLARKTDGFTGADLKAVFDLTIEQCLAEAMKEGGGRLVPITSDGLLKSARQVRSSARAWFESAKNYALYSNQSGLYDDVLKHLKIRL